MKIYSIINLKWNGALIDFVDTKSRLSNFFIWNEGDGKFLNLSIPRGKAQSSFRVDKLKNSDYLPSNIEIPILSKKSKEIFEKKIPSEMSFMNVLLNVMAVRRHSFFARLKNIYRL